MPGYYLHFAACGGKSLENRSFVLGVEAPDILKKHLKVCGGIEAARAKYESIRTDDAPEYHEFEIRVQQKETHGSTDGLHYGRSSSPDIKAFWYGLSENQKNNPFYRGYAWHLLTDAIMYGRLDIDAKFQKFLEENQGLDNIDELRKVEVKKLHTDWDKTNACVREAYPEISLPEEVKELGVVQYITEGELVYVDWRVLKDTIKYLRSFDPINGDMAAIIETVLSNI